MLPVVSVPHNMLPVVSVLRNMLPACCFRHAVPRKHVACMLFKFRVVACLHKQHNITRICAEEVPYRMLIGCMGRYDLKFLGPPNIYCRH